MTYTIVAAAALVLVAEGLAPRAMKAMMARLADAPEERLRAIGLGAAGAGVLALWAMRVMVA